VRKKSLNTSRESDGKKAVIVALESHYDGVRKERGQSRKGGASGKGGRDGYEIKRKSQPHPLHNFQMEARGEWPYNKKKGAEENGGRKTVWGFVDPAT